MKLICGPAESMREQQGFLPVVLYEQAPDRAIASAGQAVALEIRRRKIEPAQRAWDLVSLALSVIVADFAAHRGASADGWTREFELEVAVRDPDFWNAIAPEIEHALQFLTTDRWALSFRGGGAHPAAPGDPTRPESDSVLLLSGGLDSLVGAIDLFEQDRLPLAVSQVVRGDAENQSGFAKRFTDGVNHLSLNHNTRVPGRAEDSQRARSFIFLAYGVLAATSLRRYHDGDVVSLFACENGFIAVNPALTDLRLGSLSTRTAHPEFLRGFQRVLDAAGLRVTVENPYRFRTKGEMLVEARDQVSLKAIAAKTTSCGRFQRYGYRHCGRCVPCQVRRAAFVAWDEQDETEYVFTNLGQDDAKHAGFDDVRSVAMAIARVANGELNEWLRPAITSAMLPRSTDYRAVLERGVNELAALHRLLGVA